MTRQERVIWAAGFFDGEGSVSIKFNKSTGQYCIRITAAQVTEAPLFILQELFGGKLRQMRHTPAPGKAENWRPCFQWECLTRSALCALREMRPWLVVKAPQADLAEEFASKLAPRGRPGNGWDKSGQAAVFDRMRVLNQRGRAS